MGDNGKWIMILPVAGVIILSVVIIVIVLDDSPPNLVGEWHGVNRTVSDLKGFKEWEKTVHITEQQDRRFRGYFDYSEGRKNFFGVIYPKNRRFAWVASDSKGYNFGRVHHRNKISTCYVEAWEEATAGCVVLRRKKQ